MKIDRQLHFPGRPTRRKAPEVDALVAHIMATPEDRLAEVLRSVKLHSPATYSIDRQTDLQPFADVLDRFDEILERHSHAFGEAGQGDVLTPAIVTEAASDLVCEILRFTTDVLDLTYNKQAYASLDRLYNLLAERDLRVVRKVFYLLLVASSPARQSNGLRPVRFDRQLHLLERAAQFARGHNPGEIGYSLLALSSSETKEFPAEATTLEFDYVTQEESEGRRDLAGPTHGNIRVEHMDQVDEDAFEFLRRLVEKHGVSRRQQFALLCRIRLAQSFGNIERRRELVRVKVAAIALLVQADAPFHIVEAIFVDDFEVVEEIIAVLESNSVPTKVREACLRCLVAFAQDRRRMTTCLTAMDPSAHQLFIPTLLRKCVAAIASPDGAPAEGAEGISRKFVDIAMVFFALLSSTSFGASSLVATGAFQTLLPLLRIRDPSRDELVIVSVRIIQSLFKRSDAPGDASFSEMGGFDLFVDRLGYEMDQLEAILDSDAGKLKTADDPLAKGRRASALSVKSSFIRTLLSFVGNSLRLSSLADRVRGLLEGRLPSLLRRIVERGEDYGPHLFAAAISLLANFVHHEPTTLSHLQESGVAGAVLSALVNKIPPSSEVLCALPHVLSALCLNAAGLEAFASSRPFEGLFRIFLSPEYRHALVGGTSSKLGTAMDELLRHQPTLREEGITAAVALVTRLRDMGVDPSIAIEREETGAPERPMKRSMRLMDLEDKEERLETDAELDAAGPAEGRQLVPLLDYIANVSKFVGNLLASEEHRKMFVRLKGADAMCDLFGLACLPVDFGTTVACAQLCNFFVNLLSSGVDDIIPLLCSRLDALIADTESGLAAARASGETAPQGLYRSLGLLRVLIGVFTSVSREHIHARTMGAMTTYWATPEGRAMLSELGRLHRLLLAELSMRKATALIEGVKAAKSGAPPPKEKKEDKVTDPMFRLCQVASGMHSLLSSTVRLLMSPRRARPLSGRVSPPAKEVVDAVAGIIRDHFDASCGALIPLSRESAGTPGGEVDTAAAAIYVATATGELSQFFFEERGRVAHTSIIAAVEANGGLDRFFRTLSDVAALAQPSSVGDAPKDPVCVALETVANRALSCMFSAVERLSNAQLVAGSEPPPMPQRFGFPIPPPDTPARSSDSAATARTVQKRALNVLVPMWSSPALVGGFAKGTLDMLLMCVADILKSFPSKPSQSAAGEGAPSAASEVDALGDVLSTLGGTDLTEEEIEMLREALNLSRSISVGTTAAGKGKGKAKDSVAPAASEEETPVHTIMKSLIGTCLAILDAHEGTAVRVGELIALACKRDDGAHAERILGELVEGVLPAFQQLAGTMRLGAGPFDGDMPRRVYARAHVIALALGEARHAMAAILRNSSLFAEAVNLVELAAECLVRSTAAAPTTLCVDWIAPVLLMLDAHARVAAMPRKPQAGSKDGDGNGRGKGKAEAAESLPAVQGLTPQEGSRLLHACLRLLQASRMSRDSTSAALQLVVRFTKDEGLAAEFVSAGGVQAVLAIPPRAAFRGMASLVAMVLRHVVEDGSALKSAASTIVRDTLRRHASRGLPSCDLRAALKAVTGVAYRSEAATEAAFLSHVSAIAIPPGSASASAKNPQIVYREGDDWRKGSPPPKKDKNGSAGPSEDRGRAADESPERTQQQPVQPTEPPSVSMRLVVSALVDSLMAAAAEESKGDAAVPNHVNGDGPVPMEIDAVARPKGDADAARSGTGAGLDRTAILSLLAEILSSYPSATAAFAENGQRASVVRAVLEGLSVARSKAGGAGDAQPRMGEEMLQAACASRHIAVLIALARADATRELVTGELREVVREASLMEEGAKRRARMAAIGHVVSSLILFDDAEHPLPRVDPRHDKADEEAIKKVLTSLVNRRFVSALADLLKTVELTQPESASDVKGLMAALESLIFTANDLGLGAAARQRTVSSGSAVSIGNDSDGNDEAEGLAPGDEQNAAEVDVGMQFMRQVSNRSQRGAGPRAPAAEVPRPEAVGSHVRPTPGRIQAALDAASQPRADVDAPDADPVRARVDHSRDMEDGYDGGDGRHGHGHGHGHAHAHAQRPAVARHQSRRMDSVSSAGDEDGDDDGDGDDGGSDGGSEMEWEDEEGHVRRMMQAMQEEVRESDSDSEGEGDEDEEGRDGDAHMEGEDDNMLLGHRHGDGDGEGSSEGGEEDEADVVEEEDDDGDNGDDGDDDDDEDSYFGEDEGMLFQNERNIFGAPGDAVRMGGMAGIGRGARMHALPYEDDGFEIVDDDMARFDAFGPDAFAEELDYVMMGGNRAVVAPHLLLYPPYGHGGPRRLLEGTFMGMGRLSSDDGDGGAGDPRTGPRAADTERPPNPPARHNNTLIGPHHLVARAGGADPVPHALGLHIGHHRPILPPGFGIGPVEAPSGSVMSTHPIHILEAVLPHVDEIVPPAQGASQASQAQPMFMDSSAPVTPVTPVTPVAPAPSRVLANEAARHAVQAMQHALRPVDRLSELMGRARVPMGRNSVATVAPVPTHERWLEEMHVLMAEDEAEDRVDGLVRRIGERLVRMALDEMAELDREAEEKRRESELQKERAAAERKRQEQERAEKEAAARLAASEAAPAPATQSVPLTSATDAAAPSTAPPAAPAAAAPAPAQPAAQGLPPGIDPDFLEALPPELRAEVLAQQLGHLAALSGGVPGGSAPLFEGDFAAGLEQVSPEYLAALPPEIQVEVLEQQERMRQRAQSSAAAPAAAPAVPEVDNATFLASLPPELREEIFLEQDEAFIASLPPDLAAEAQQVRDRAHRRAARHHNMPGFGVMSQALAGERHERDRRLVEWAVASTAPDPNTVRGAGSRPRQRNREQPRRSLLDQGSIAALLRLVFSAQAPNPWIPPLSAVLQALGGHGRTRTWIMCALFSIFDRLQAPQYVAPGAASAAGGESAHAPQSPALDGDGLPAVTTHVARQVLDIISDMCSSFPRGVGFLLSDEWPVRVDFWDQYARALDIAVARKGKAPAQKGAPIAYMISLLQHPVFERNPGHTESLLGIAGMILKQVPLPHGENDSRQGSNGAKREANGASAAAPAPGTQNGTAATTAAAPAGVEAAGDKNEDKKEDGKPGERKRYVAPVIAPDLLRLLVNILSRPACSERSAFHVLSMLQRLATRTENFDVVTKELLVVTQQLGEVVCDDLTALAAEVVEKTREGSAAPAEQNGRAPSPDAGSASTDAPREATPASARPKAKEAVSVLELKTLSRLTAPAAAQFLFVRSLRMLASLENPSTGKGEHGMLGAPGASPQVPGLDAVWEALSAALDAFEAAGDHHCNNALMPAMEAFMVAHGGVRRLGRIQHVPQGLLTAASAPGASQRGAPSLARQDSVLDADGRAQAPLDAETERFVRFTERHRKVLNDIVRRVPSALSSGNAFSVLVAHPRILDFDNKRLYFRHQLRRREQGQHAPTLRLNVRRDRVFEDSFQKIARRTPEELRGRLSVRFTGEEGIDAGGVTREWYLMLSREMFNPNYALFRTSAVDRVTYQPDSKSGINTLHLEYFRFIGRIIAKAICDGKMLECYFTRAFYKHILGIPVTYHDLEAVDPEYYKSLKWMVENDITGVLDATFSIEISEFGAKRIVDLKPDGRNVPVTEENKREYVQLVALNKLTSSIRAQIDAFLTGFHDLIPHDLIQIFNEQELELLISGLPEIDVEDLKANTEYAGGGYSESSPQIHWFWRALRSFDREERAKFLQFVTGTSKVPLQGFKALEGMSGVQRFSIHKDYGATDRLPSAHTCFNQLDLPEYTSYDVLRRQLLTAVNECSEGFGFG